MSQQYVRCFVESFGWFVTDNCLSISMEYCEFGDLHKYMQDHGRLPEEESREIAAQLAEGLHFMHSENFAHRDLKPRVSIKISV